MESGRGTRQKARQGCPAPGGNRSAERPPRTQAQRGGRGGRAGPGREALGVPAAGGHGRRERPPAASPPQMPLAPRRALSIPPRPRARFSTLALPGAGSSEACP